MSIKTESEILSEYEAPIAYVHKNHSVYKVIIDICKFFDFQLNPITNGDGALHAVEFGDKSVWLQYRFDNFNLGSIDQVDVQRVWLQLFTKVRWVGDKEENLDSKEHFLTQIDRALFILEKESNFCVGGRRSKPDKLSAYVAKIKEIASVEGFPLIPDVWKSYALKQEVS